MQSSSSKNLLYLYLHNLIFFFALSIYPLLTPVFLSKMLGGLEMVFLIWNMVWTITFFLFLLPCFNFSMKYSSSKWMMILGLFVNISSVIALTFLKERMFLFVMGVSILVGFQGALYWMNRHWIISLSTNLQSMGKQMSGFEIISIVTSIAGPIIGGSLAYWFSFHSGFVLSALALLFSIVPLALVKFPVDTKRYSIPSLTVLLRSPDQKPLFPVYFWEGVLENCYFVAWPLAFITFVGNIQEIGLVLGGSALLAAILTAKLGIHFDKGHRKSALKKTTYFRSATIILYPLLAFYPSPLLALVIETLNKVSGSLHRTIQNAYIFGLSNKVHPGAFHVNREVGLSVGRVVSNLVIGIGILYFGTHFLWVAVGMSAFMQFAWLWLGKLDAVLEV